jgi:hypothetical protein
MDPSTRRGGAVPSAPAPALSFLEPARAARGIVRPALTGALAGAAVATLLIAGVLTTSVVQGALGGPAGVGRGSAALGAITGSHLAAAALAIDAVRATLAVPFSVEAALLAVAVAAIVGGHLSLLASAFGSAPDGDVNDVAARRAGAAVVMVSPGVPWDVGTPTDQRTPPPGH